MSERGPSEPPRGRDDAKQETRDALIEAGLTAFAEEGLDAPSLDSICARAGYTRGAFYVHFADREDFQAAVMDSVLQTFMDAIISSDGSPLDLDRTIDAFADAVSSGTFPTRPAVPMHQFLAACERSDRVRERYRELLREAAKRVAAIAGEAQRAGSLRSDISRESVAATLIAITHGVQGMVELGYELDVESLRASVKRLIEPREA